MKTSKKQLISIIAIAMGLVFTIPVMASPQNNAPQAVSSSAPMHTGTTIVSSSATIPHGTADWWSGGGYKWHTQPGGWHNPYGGWHSGGFGWHNPHGGWYGGGGHRG